ncbi:disease resistance protein L6-like isoform X2 [Syzygium oleosum]|uniref:disease resistance protein L6-like isoform X2 n=1 Tax=Syzygium oleosum TaxID=219896 RepID=UPI0024BA9EB3|nr:disease resistance protein L6-like isoform X2 [Syzygium oleosum]
MHRLIFGHSFAELVALILLPGLAFYFLNKKKTSARRNAEDVDTGASGSMTVPTKTNSGGSSLSPTKTDNDASSSLTALTESRYEVFLSFRGSDTRHGFTDHLYHGLLKAGIVAFRDDDELYQGENIGPKLMAAITTSKILIPILSETYGTSSWCLDELVQIMERKKNNGQIVFPIFYKVKPADVKYQSGSFGEAFHKRETRLLKRSFDQTILDKWKQALLEVSNLKGYEANWSEAELVKLVVQKVLSELKKKFELVTSKNLVGIGSHVENIMELMDNNSHAPLFVGIHGMGGIGKTTLAKAIYNKLSNQFEHHSFIADIRESWKHYGTHYLQSKLINDISKHEIKVDNEDEGTNFISFMFKAKKVLVLLDDVDNVNQVKCLAGNHEWFSLGSRIIITTRDKRILELAGVDHNYELMELDDNQSLILFSQHAFRMDFPPSKFEGLTREVVSTTGGLPLSLEVLGSLLYGKESKVWRDMIKKLKKVPRIEVQEKLRISYEALEYEQKQIFLDIACFLIGADRRIVFYMWDACDFFPGENIEVLRFMSLIKIGDNHELQMHDQLRDLGRTIVREENQQQPWNRSRLWDSKEVLEVLKGYKMAKKLKYLDLTDCHCLRNTIFLSAFKHLEVLILKKCRGLEQIDPSIGDMKALLRLDLKRCESLGKLPAEIESLENLEILKISHTGIKELPKGIGRLRKLRELRASACRLKGELPESMCNLSSLQRLDFVYCKQLQSLPDNLPSSLTDLSVTCGSRKLPSLSHLTHLKRLRVWFCSFLECIEVLPSTLSKNSECSQPTDIEESELPQSLNTPFELEFLIVGDCGFIKTVDVSQFIHLRELYVINCKNLVEVRGLELDKLIYLESLTVSRCGSIKRLLLPKSKSLKKLDASRCKKLAEIQGLDRLEFLESLDITECASIEKLDLSKSGRLKKLDAGECNKLAEIQGLDTLEFLESLNISRCASIEKLDLPKSGRLKRLDARMCEKLAEIQGLDTLEFLESLNIIGCTSIEKLDLPKSGRLEVLYAYGCENLAEIQGLDTLEFLKILFISECASIKRLDLPKSGRLNILNAVECINLAEIQGLDTLEFLESLDISRCASIEKLDLPKSWRLKELYAYGCENLAEIQGLDTLEFLESLYISECASIKRLDLPKSGRLKILNAVECINLAEIQGLDTLEFLESLDISGSKSLKTIPELPRTRIYQNY